MTKAATPIASCLLGLAVLVSLVSGVAFARDFCLSNAHGIHLTANDGLVETTISEQNRMNGSVCELENQSDGTFKVTIFANKTFKKDIHGISLNEISESYLRVYKKAFGTDVAILEKKEILVPKPGYLMTFRSNKMECLIIHYAAFNSGLEYSAAFTFPEKYKTKYVPLVQSTLEGLDFATRIPLVASINSTEFSFFRINMVRIPYPSDWRIYSADNIDELKSSEVDDHFYSKLLLSKEATHVFKSKYENEQLFTMTLTVIPKQFDLDRVYSDLRLQVNALYQKDYGSDYVDKSVGKIVIKERPYYTFAFETTKVNNHFVTYQFWFVNKGFTYAIRFKSPGVLFQDFKTKMDEIIEKIEN